VAGDDQGSGLDPDPAQQLGQSAYGEQDVVRGDRPTATVSHPAVLRSRHHQTAIRQRPGHRPRVSAVVLGLPEPTVNEYDDPVGRPVGQVQVDHGILVVGVPEHGVGQHDRHRSAGPPGGDLV
jgi:hypothetical protein